MNKEQTKTWKAGRFRESNQTAKIEAWYQRRLSEVAQMVGRIAQEFKEDSDVYGQEKAVQLQLFSYADTIEAWAYDISEIMLRRAAQADDSVWLRVGEKISAETKRFGQSCAVIRNGTTREYPCKRYAFIPEAVNR